MSAGSQPYLTFVVYSRNDDHIGQPYLPRIQASIESLLDQTERHALPSELVLVEWNPPPERPRFREALRLPSSSAQLSIRLIETEPAHHRRYRHWDKRPVQGAVAFNIAIRRARGRFVASRSSDVFYSEALVAFLAKQTLESDAVYRCDRCDVASEVFDHRDGVPLEEFLERCADQVQHRFVRLGVPDDSRLPALHTNASGDFTLASRELWHRARGFYEAPNVASMDADSLTQYVLRAVGGREIALEGPLCLYKISHPNRYVNSVRTIEREWWQGVRDRIRRLPAILAPPLEDRVQTMLRPVYRERRGMEGVRLPSYHDYLRTCRRLLAKRGRRLLNGPRWGLAGAELPERMLCRADWEPGSSAARPGDPEA